MKAPTSIKGEHTPSPSNTQKSSDTRQQFAVFALNMSWQLAVVVLVPVVGGVELDKAFSATNTFLFIGLAIALIGSGLVLWRTMQAANRLPVPKLTDDQKRAIQKSYEEEDEE
jgi:F0F1-type ATP synthase assembly protein I